MDYPHHTIVAVSSPPGRSTRGLVRFTGHHVSDIVAALLDPPTTAAAAFAAPRTLHHVRLRRPTLPPIPALLAAFAAPASYTGQDVAELQVPGHPALLHRLLACAIEHGARLAEPGEFTFRAYAAGRIDLTQAEGIAATIAAVSDSQLAAASHLRRGRLGEWSAGLVDELGQALALTEAGIDFVDQEDVVAIAPVELAQRLEAIADQLETLAQRSRSWGQLEALPRVVLVGPPSAGKSTLFNALLGHRRAVIDEAPGTTRDVLAEPMTLTDPRGQPMEIELVDIAGLDEPTAALDRQVQAAARAAVAQADLLVTVTEADEPLTEPPANVPALHVRTKADRVPPPQRTDDALWVSAQGGENLDALRHAITQRIGERGVSITADMLALQPRHEQALRTTREHLAAARALLAPQRHQRQLDQMELIANEMRAALDALASLGGHLTPDDVLGRIFASFCIGK